jgi:hypothetical protein
MNLFGVEWEEESGRRSLQAEERAYEKLRNMKQCSVEKVQAVLHWAVV